ncbi:hypothetical protein [Shimia sp. SDUM112013]|uniref:hypothetical protein n=1 Tax=Shimia sp. SDUM112013 TaxID=3136160 RepID=UPI0032EB3C2B
MTFNPKCNQSTGTVKLTSGVPSCAEVAAKAMAEHAAYRAQQVEYEKAKAAQANADQTQPTRWLKESDLE